VAKTFPDYFEAMFGVVDAEAAEVPVITVDGPTASGKGTLAAALAERLGYHTLDSGSLYRATALAALQDRIAPDDETALARLASILDLRFDGAAVVLRGRAVSDDLRREEVGSLASRIAALPAVREALHGLQLAFRRAPGLVADGRDMGTVVFPDAALKVFLTASAESRAKRRHKQLKEKGFPANLSSLLQDLQQRDARDSSRAVSPLVPARGAYVLDSTTLTIEQTVAAVLARWASHG
jgi:3-phosphoshikimate 1-carboxyvinyltransferase